MVRQIIGDIGSKDFHKNRGGKLMNHLNMIRQKNPLIYNITNQVVKNFTANGLLALGASPAMANAPEEAEEMVRQADCLVLNIGTVSKNQVEAMLLAGREANKNNIPVILDPVAVGATTFRTYAVKSILKQFSLKTIREDDGEKAPFIYVYEIEYTLYIK